MDENINRKDLDRLVDHFGIETIIATLPQKEVCEVLGLMCMKDLTQELGVRYGKLRHHMQAGTIPFPEVRLLRRAYFRKKEVEAIRKKFKQDNRK